jgi:hypothetical protein
MTPILGGFLRWCGSHALGEAPSYQDFGIKKAQEVKKVQEVISRDQWHCHMQVHDEGIQNVHGMCMCIM